MTTDSEAIAHLRALIKDPLGHVARACEFLAEVDARPKDEPTEAEKVCYETYQVVGSLLSDLGQFDTDRAGKILDNLAHAQLMHKDVLPWPSFEKPIKTQNK